MTALERLIDTIQRLAAPSDYRREVIDAARAEQAELVEVLRDAYREIGGQDAKRYGYDGLAGKISPILAKHAIAHD